MHVYFLSDTLDGIDCCDRLRFELINMHVNIRSDTSDGIDCCDRLRQQARYELVTTMA